MNIPAHNSVRLPSGERTRASAGARPALLRALAGDRPERTPVWFMRQAGRSLPEYRRLREEAGVSMLDACLTPALAAEATLQPVRRHGVDAAILFSDIMVPLRLAGVGVRIEPGTGPVMDAPVRDSADVAAVTARSLGDGDGGADGASSADGVAAVERAVRTVVAELGAPLGQQAPGADAPGDRDGATGRNSATDGEAGLRSPLTGQALSERARAGLAESRGTAAFTPLIGFGGAPFTLAAYLVEGRPSRDHLAARTLLHADPAAWDRLMTWCARLTGQFIATQVRAGASAVQLFDSWAGSLSPTTYRHSVLPYSRLALDVARDALSPVTGERASLIHFGTGTARILAGMRAAGADVVGVDERTDLGEALEALSAPRPGEAPGAPQGPCPVQGNIDPALLAAPWEVLDDAVTTCLEAARAAPAHVVNLGHGVPPGTDPDVLTRLVARVHHCSAWEQVALTGWETTP